MFDIFRGYLKKKVFYLNSSTYLILGSALFLTIFSNMAFFRQVYLWLGMNSFYDYILLVSFVIFIFCFLNILFSLFFIGFLKKPLLVIILCCSALGSYFSLFYGIYIDEDMIVNVLQTNAGEATALLNIKLVVWFIILGILPSIIVIFFIKIKTVPIVKSILSRVISIVVSAVVLGLMYWSLLGGYSLLLKTNKDSLDLISPTNYIYGIATIIADSFHQKEAFVHIGEDAKRIPPSNEVEHKKKLLIIVVGETSRAQNFSLNGYERETNPLLKQHHDLINFERASSCGTATAVSVPCMFSNMEREDFSRSDANNQDNLLDILARAGINILWKENDGGCKDVCTRVPTIELDKVEPVADCPRGLCHDIKLLDGLDKYINQQKDDTVIVLHTNGSHGPLYYERYTKAQELFTPTCKSSQVDNCPKDQLINAYDNTIVNVDYVLDATIKLLKRHDNRFATAMFYMSDHGESLGEDNTYLHGAPYSLAPEEQTHIPMIFWLSDAFLKEQNVNKACLLDKAKHKKVSHDNLFHTSLGAMSISTKEYESKLDLLSNCKE